MYFCCEIVLFNWQTCHSLIRHQAILPPVSAFWFEILDSSFPMADVIDVVHKITYEVNTDPLQKTNELIENQVRLLSGLNKLLQQYVVEIGRAGRSVSKDVADIAKTIDVATRQIEKNAQKSKSSMSEVLSGAMKGLGLDGGLEGGVSRYVAMLKEHFISLATAGKEAGSSMDKMGHVIAALGKGKIQGASSAVSSFAGSLLSMPNAAGLAISALTVLGSMLLDYIDNADKASESTALFSKLSEDVAGNAASELANLKVLVDTMTNTNLSYKQRGEALTQLQSLYPEYFGMLDKEKALNGEIKEAYEGVTATILRNAKIKAQTSLLENAYLEKEAAETKLKGLRGGGTNTFVYYDNSYEADLKNTIARKQRDIDAIAAKIQEEKEFENPQFGYYLNPEDRKRDEQRRKSERNNYYSYGRRYSPSEDKIKNTKADKAIVVKPVNDYESSSYWTDDISKRGALQAQLEIMKRGLVSVKNLEMQQTKDVEAAYSNGLKTYEAYEEDKLLIKQRFAKARLKTEILELKSLLDNKDISDVDKEVYKHQLSEKELELVQTTNAEKHDKEVKDKKAKDDAETKRQARIKETVAAYQNLAAEAVKAINTIYDAQIKALDNEIKVRERRVEQAKKLAERGNAEVLKMEEERLAEAQKKKEAYAKKEAILNAALAFSNSLVAVTGAVANAVKGDPYTVAARVAAAIAAVLAALGSGYAFVQSFKSDGAFADGVVDFRGKGGPRDDANWVRISSGESVITAEGTRQNRQLLEAINSGAKLQFFNPALAYTMPVFASPGNSTKSYASQNDLRNVETKLDGVIAAIEDNRMKQNIFFNEHGVGVMTERAIRRDRKRWM